MNFVSKMKNVKNFFVQHNGIIMTILAILILSAAIANNNFENEFNRVKVWALTGSHQSKVNEVKIQNTDKHLEELDKKFNLKPINRQ